ncbi:MAG: alkaline phosphatase family protein [Candidatus Lokiarchaeia archaeon]
MVKVLVIGLDGGTWNIIEPLVNAGKLPTIAKLMKEGCYGDLESSLPSTTFPAWKCFSTGKNPGKLGVYYHMGIDTKKRKSVVYNSTYFRSKELWDYLGQNNITCGVIGMPTTYPPKKINGFMVSEFVPKEVGFTYPKELETELKNNLNYSYEQVEYHNISKRFFINERIKLIKQRFDAAHYLIDKYNPSFLHLTIFHTDHIQHFYWNYMEENNTKYGKVIENVWIFIDKEISKLLAHFKDDNLYTFIISDHGFTAIKAIFDITQWFINEKYLYLNYKTNYRQALLNFILKLADLAGIRSILISIINKVKKLPFFKIFIPSTSTIHASMLETPIDWNRSKAIPLCAGLVYLNLNILRTDEAYNKTREEIISEVKKIKNPKVGEKLAKEVFKKEEIYNGEYLDQAPDIIILPNDGYDIRDMIRNKKIWSFSQKRGWSATHKLHGIFIAHGKNLRTGLKTSNIKIYDIAPTILHVFNLPVPLDMDGNVLKEIFKKDCAFYKRNILYQKEESEINKEIKFIKKRLKQLKKYGKI